MISGPRNEAMNRFLESCIAAIRLSEIIKLIDDFNNL